MKGSLLTFFIAIYFNEFNGELYKRIPFPGNIWPTKIKNSMESKSTIECGGHCESQRCDLYVIKPDLMECHVGYADYSAGTLPTEETNHPTYVSITRIDQIMNELVLKIHDVEEYSNWKTHIYSSLTFTDDPNADGYNCRAQCLFIEVEQCQFFIEDENAKCHLGSFSVTDGTVELGQTTNHVYAKKDQFEAQSNVTFDHNYEFQGILWNTFALWTNTLETEVENHALECIGMCYFHHPEPFECGFAVPDSVAGVCYLGSFMAESAAEGLTTLDDAQIFQGRVKSSKLTNVFLGSKKGRISRIYNAIMIPIHF